MYDDSWLQNVPGPKQPNDAAAQCSQAEARPPLLPQRHHLQHRQGSGPAISKIVGHKLFFPGGVFHWFL